MRLMLAALLCMLVSACNTVPRIASDPTDLLHDELFAPATVQIRPEAALEMSEPMKEFARNKLSHRLGRVDNEDRRTQLIKALYTKGLLRLDYYSEVTRTASEAFDAQSGNCMSLVLLTAAMANQLQLPYHYQLAIGAADWSESDDFFMTIGHVNLVLEELPPSEFELHTWSATPLVVDFLVPDLAAQLETTTINEDTILAMYLNNRSVETLVQGDINNAYWWVKASLKEDPMLSNAYLTLAVIYRNMHRPELANLVLERVAVYDPNNTTMLTDRILVLRDLGRPAEADKLAKKLADVDQNRPWEYYFEAQSEYRAGHYEKAKKLLEKEIALENDHHEFEFGLAQIYSKMNDVPNATQHLELAIKLSNTRRSKQKYLLKLEQLKTAGTM